MQIHEAGAEKLSLRGVAGAVGMSAAGLYRYYDSREELLTDLITDAFHGLADALETARDADPDWPPGERLLAASLAYRRWALERRRVFALLYGSPVPGYTAPTEGAAVQASLRVARAFLLVLEQAWSDGTFRPSGDPIGDRAALDDKAALLGLDLPGELLAVAVGVWGRLHGLVCLEVFGHLEWAGRVAGTVFRDQVTADLLRIGLAPLGRPSQV